MFTGHEVREFKPQSEHPEFLSITNRLRGNVPRELPNYVGAPPIPYLGAAYLGPAADAFAVHGDPNLPEFKLPNAGPPVDASLNRIDQRRGLRAQLDRLARSLDDRGNMQAGDQLEQMAWNILATPVARRASDLSQEDAAVRDRYGRNT